MTDDGSGGSAYAGPRVRVRKGRRAKLPTFCLLASTIRGVTESEGYSDYR